MHAHSRYSDSTNKIGTIAKQCIAKGIGIAMTDHNEILANFKLKEALRGHPEILLVPGIEVSSKQGPHILLYFYELEDLAIFYERHIKQHKKKNPYTALNITAEEIIEAASGFQCLKGIAHPFAPGFMGIEKLLKRKGMDNDLVKKCDFVEVINGRVTEKMNLRACKLALEDGKSYTGGSDAHTRSEIGSTITAARATTLAEFLDAIKHRENLVIGKQVRMNKPYSYMITAGKHLRYPGTTLRENFERKIKRPLQYFIPKLKKMLRW